MRTAYSTQGCTVFPVSPHKQLWCKRTGLVWKGLLLFLTAFLSPLKHVTQVAHSAQHLKHLCMTRPKLLLTLVALTSSEALMNAPFSRWVILHGSNYTHIVIVRQATASWRVTEVETITALLFCSNFRFRSCCLLEY